MVEMFSNLLAMPCTCSGQSRLIKKVYFLKCLCFHRLRFVCFSGTMSEQKAVELAVTCGLEITRRCGNYQISLTKNKNMTLENQQNQLSSMLLMSAPPGAKTSPSSSRNSKRTETNA